MTSPTGETSDPAPATTGSVAARVADSLLLVATGFVLLRLVRLHYGLITLPYQGEYREGASLLLTRALAAGVDPYASALQPAHTYVYGFLANLVAAGLSGLVGSSFLIERTLVALYLGAGLALLYRVLARVGVPVAWRLAGVVLVYAAMMEQGTTLLARPDALGWALFLAAISVPWLRRWTPGSFTASVVFVVLAFYTKPYFLIAALCLGTYLFIFVSKRTALLYGTAVVGLLCLSVLIVHSMGDLYFANTLFTHARGAGHSRAHLFRQFTVFLQFSGWLLAALVAALALRGAERGAAAAWGGRPRLDWRHPREPLWRDADGPMQLFVVALVLGLVALYASLGRHRGAFMTYFHQLASPFLVVVVLGALARVRAMRPVRVALLVAAVLHPMGFYAQQVAAASHDRAGWEALDELIARHERILNSPAIVGLLLTHRRSVYDSGHSEYFQLAWDHRHDVQRHFREYRAGLARMVANREFDLVALSPRPSRLIDADALARVYRRTRTVQLTMPYALQTWQVEIWERLE